ncbi:MAG: hypothetical protein ACRENE_03735 [Polyangiaceae bacterium]
MQPARGFVSCIASCAFVAFAGATAGCSALLDWNGYTGGDAGDAGNAGNTEAGIAEAGPAGGDSGEGGAHEGGIACGSNCGGCCNAGGLCAGGQSGDSCGAGGVACVDCTTRGMVCSAGACAPASLEAGPPPPCDPTACGMRCYALVYEQGCCKSDMTCGCQVVIPTKGACM